MALVILFVALAIFCAAIVVYPYAIYPLILRVLPVVDFSPSGHRPRSVTLVFCAYNEGETLQAKIKNLDTLKRRYPDLEVLAYDDGSDDDTLELLNSRPDLITVVTGEGRKGKAHGMKKLASVASGEIMVFTDANVLLDEDAIDNLKNWYRDPAVGGVCGSLHYINSGESATASVGGAYWRLEETLKSLESRTGNVMGADGSIFSLRRDLYPSFPDSVLDDLTVSMAAVFAGKRLLKVDDVIAYERLVSARQDEFARKVRISARAFHTHLYLRPQLRRMAAIDKFKYASRKLVRWFGAFFVILGTALAMMAAVLMSPWVGVAVAIVLGLLILGGSRVKSGPIGQLAEIFIALFATLVGVMRAIRGQTVVTWSPAKSR